MPEKMGILSKEVVIIMPDLSKISTKSLVDELRNREAVQEITAEPYQEFEVRIESERIDIIPESGPAVILVIWD